MRSIMSGGASALRYSLVLVSLLAVAPAGAAETIVGRASVTDGDTLEIRGTRIRLHGVDAPESAQLCSTGGKDYRCGQRAANALSERIGAANVSCVQKDKDRYGRVVAVCSVKGEELNRWLVAQGHALAYRRYGGGVYDDAETAAKKAKRGVWAGSFEEPWDWRKQKREGRRPASTQTAGATAAPSGCRIKGNIGSGGAKIYHLPGSSSYGGTKIDPSKGERMFCSEAEAKAAGWRAPR